MSDFRPGLSAGQVDAQLRGALKAYRTAEERSVLWFAEVLRRRLYRELGFSSIQQYAGERLGFSAGKTAQFLRLAEALDRLPALRRSVASGEVPWTAAREVARVATPGTEASWLREARGSSRRALERKIRASRSRARAARRRNPAQGGLALVDHPGEGGPALVPAAGSARSTDPLAAPAPGAAPERTSSAPASLGANPERKSSALASSDAAPECKSPASASPGAGPERDPAPAVVSGSDSPAHHGRTAGVPAIEAGGCDDLAVDIPVVLSFRLSPLEYACYEALIEALRKAGEKGSRNEVLLAAMQALVIERRASRSAGTADAIDATGSPHPRAGESGASVRPTGATGSTAAPESARQAQAEPTRSADVPGGAGQGGKPGPSTGPAEPQSTSSATSRYPGKEAGSRRQRPDDRGRSDCGTPDREPAERGTVGRGPAERGTPDRAPAGRGTPDRGPADPRSAVRVATSYPVYQVFVRRCDDCGRGFVATGRGERELARHRLEAVLCDARLQRPGDRNRAAVPPSVRRKVLARDGHRCRMPGCGRNRFIEVHHVRPRAAGGSNRPENLITLCSACHGLLHEMGEARATAFLSPLARRGAS